MVSPEPSGPIQLRGSSPHPHGASTASHCGLRHLFSNSPCPTPPLSPSEWLCSLNTPVLCSEAPTAQDKGNGESISMRACSEPVTMAGPHKVHVNNLLTRDVLMSFVTRTLLTSVSKFTHITNCQLVSAKTSQSVKCY